MPSSALIILSFTGCIVILTGPTDYVSDGQTVVALNNGNAMLGRITGSGCLVGTCTATYCAAASALADVKAKNDGGKLVNGDMFLAAITGYALELDYRGILTRFLFISESSCQP